jgi:hypothetical protein
MHSCAAVNDNPAARSYEFKLEESRKKLSILNCVSDSDHPKCESSRFQRVQGYWLEYKQSQEWARFKEIRIDYSNEKLIFYGNDPARNVFVKIEKRKGVDAYYAYWAWANTSLENAKWQSILGNFIPGGYDYTYLSKSNENAPTGIGGEISIAGKLRISTPSGETWGTRVGNAFGASILPNNGPGNTFNSQGMWHSASAPDGWVSLDLEFPISVNLTSLKIYSQHSGLYHAAVGAKVWAMGPGETFRLLAEQALAAPDAEVSFGSTSSKFWRIELQAGRSGEVLLRGMRFFSGLDELKFNH